MAGVASSRVDSKASTRDLYPKSIGHYTKVAPLMSHMPGLVLHEGKWVPYYVREEALGEHPALDPFFDEEPLECGLEDPEVCESCQ